MAIGNAVDATTAGVQCMTSGGVWNGRTITAGSGISVTNGDGVSGNPTIAATGTGPGLGTVYLFDDFLGVCLYSSGNNTGGLGNTNINYASSSALNSIGGTGGSSTNPGIIQLTAKDTNTRSVVIYGNQTSSASFDNGDFNFGNGECSIEWYVKIPTLSTGTNRFNIKCGFGSNLGDFSSINAAPLQGCWFEYVDNVNSGAWTINCKDGSGTTTQNTATTVDTNFHNLKVVVNAAATSVAFYVDGTQVSNSPIAANIPTARQTFFLRIWQVITTTGQDRTVQADFYRFIYTLTTPRSG